MNRTALNLILLIFLLILSGLNWAIVADHTRPNWEFLPNMVRSSAVDAYADNPYITNVKKSTPLPKGVVPAAFGLGTEASLTTQGIPDSSLTSPLDTADPYEASKAAYTYRDFCLPCHGPNGLGDGTVAQRGFPPPPSLTATNAVQMSDGKLFYIISVGQGNMPGYARQMSATDRWRAVLHIRELQRAANVNSVAEVQ